MGAIGIVTVCMELSYSGVHSFRDFNGNYIYSGSYGNEADTWRSLVTASGILGGFLIMLIPYCSLVRRIKAHNVWKQSFVYQAGHRVVSVVRTFYEDRKSPSVRFLCSVFSAGYRLFSAAASATSEFF